MSKIIATYHWGVLPVPTRQYALEIFQRANCIEGFLSEKNAHSTILAFNMAVDLFRMGFAWHRRANVADFLSDANLSAIGCQAEQEIKNIKTPRALYDWREATSRFLPAEKMARPTPQCIDLTIKELSENAATTACCLQLTDVAPYLLNTTAIRKIISFQGSLLMENLQTRGRTRA